MSVDDLASRCDPCSDRDLVARIAAGDHAAFEMLARRYQQRLMRYAARSVGFADAADVVQDVLIKAFTHSHQYDRRWAVAAWLLAMTRNAAIDHLRARRRQNTTGLPNDLVAAEPNDVLRRDLHGRLWAIAAERLSAEQLQAMWLHYVEDLGTKDVARVMGRSWVWVKTALHRGRRALAPHAAHLHWSHGSAGGLSARTKSIAAWKGATA